MTAAGSAILSAAALPQDDRRRMTAEGRAILSAAALPQDDREGRRFALQDDKRADAYGCGAVAVGAVRSGIACEAAMNLIGST